MKNQKYLLIAIVIFIINFVPLLLTSVATLEQNENIIRVIMLVLSPIYVIFSLISLKKEESTIGPTILIIIGIFMTFIYLVGVGH